MKKNIDFFGNCRVVGYFDDLNKKYVEGLVLEINGKNIYLNEYKEAQPEDYNKYGFVGYSYKTLWWDECDPSFFYSKKTKKIFTPEEFIRHIRYVSHYRKREFLIDGSIIDYFKSYAGYGSDDYSFLETRLIDAK